MSVEITGLARRFGRTQVVAGEKKEAGPRPAWPASAAVITVCGAREPTRE